MAFGLSACGGGSPPGVASVGSTTTTTQAASSATAGNGGNATAKYRAALAYVNCMRSHGVPNMPDPAANGTLNVDFATGGKGGAPVSSGINRNSSRYIWANQTCRHLLPNGGVPTPAQTQQALARGVKFAQCMRSHGVPNYPDPNPTNPDVVHLVGVDPSSPQFQNAAEGVPDPRTRKWFQVIRPCAPLLPAPVVRSNSYNVSFRGWVPTQPLIRTVISSTCTGKACA